MRGKRITIELLYGNLRNRRWPTKEDLKEQIEVQQRAIDGKSLSSDFVMLLDTLSILEAIQREL
jgi:hypothetical protein